MLEINFSWNALCPECTFSYIIAGILTTKVTWWIETHNIAIIYFIPFNQECIKASQLTENGSGFLFRVLIKSIVESLLISQTVCSPHKQHCYFGPKAFGDQNKNFSNQISWGMLWNNNFCKMKAINITDMK